MSLRWLTPDGTVAAAAVGVLVLWGSGLPGAALLLLFFVSGSLLTAFNQGRERQKGQRVASAARNARQVLANGGWAAVGATAIRWKPEIGWALMVGSLATAQADTWATEIGANARLSHDAFLPTNARTNQKSIFGRHVLQDLAELRLQTFGGKARSLI